MCDEISLKRSVNDRHELFNDCSSCNRVSEEKSCKLFRLSCLLSISQRCHKLFQKDVIVTQRRYRCYNRNEKAVLLSLKDFTQALSPNLPRLKRLEQNSVQGPAQVKIRGTEDDPVTQLFTRLDLDEPELKDYVLSDPIKIVAPDNETFTLLLLCWNPG